MIKRFKRFVSLSLVFSFVWLVCASVLPASAFASSETGARPEDEIGSVERPASEGAVSVHKKSSALPIVIGVVAVGAIAAVYFLVVKKEVGIPGTWIMQWKLSTDTGYTRGNRTMQFSGNKTSGTFIYENYDGGIWNLDGDNVFILFTGSQSGWQLKGKYDKTKKTMSGTWLNTYGDEGTWVAEKH